MTSGDTKKNVRVLMNPPCPRHVSGTDKAGAPNESTTSKTPSTELAAAGIKLNAASSLGEATEVFHTIKQIKGQINKEQHVGPSPTSASVLVKRMCRDNEPLSKLCWLLFFIWCLCCPAPEICVGPSGMPELRQRLNLEALLHHCFFFLPWFWGHNA